MDPGGSILEKRICNPGAGRYNTGLVIWYGNGGEVSDVTRMLLYR